MSIPTANVEADLNTLVEFLFVTNKNNKKVFLNLPFGEDGIRNNHDLFTFCLDLLCKGLVALYGKETNKVELENLTMDDVNHIKKKLANAGIDITLDINEVMNMLDTNAVRPCIIKGNGDELKDYKLRIVSKNREYNISFELSRL